MPFANWMQDSNPLSPLYAIKSGQPISVEAQPESGPPPTPEEVTVFTTHPMEVPEEQGVPQDEPKQEEQKDAIS